MLPPMRPSPTIASSKWSLLVWVWRVVRAVVPLGGGGLAGERLGECQLERAEQLGKPLIGVVAQVHARDGQLMRLERDEIAHCLCVDERAERLVPAGDLEIVR